VIANGVTFLAIVSSPTRTLAVGTGVDQPMTGQVVVWEGPPSVIRDPFSSNAALGGDEDTDRFWVPMAGRSWTSENRAVIHRPTPFVVRSGPVG
jgi:hypothetical protein